MSHRDLTPKRTGEVEHEYDLSITTTTDTTTVVTGSLTFDRPFKSAPSIVSARISGSTLGRIATVGADTPTTTGLTGWINPRSNNLGAGTLTLKVVVCGELA